MQLTCLLLGQIDYQLGRKQVVLSSGSDATTSILLTSLTIGTRLRLGTGRANPKITSQSR